MSIAIKFLFIGLVLADLGCVLLFRMKMDRALQKRREEGNTQHIFTARERVQRLKKSGALIYLGGAVLATWGLFLVTLLFKDVLSE